MDDRIIISIGRQYGSGGREIGKKLAEIFNIDFYDKENGHATVSLFYAAPCSGNLFIKKSNGEVLKKIPIDIAWKDCEFVSSNEDIITFGDEQFEIKSTGKLTISYIYGDDVVAEKEVEVI